MALLWVIPLTAALVGLDQITKIWVAANLPFQKPLPWIPGVLNYKYDTNDGIAWSMLAGKAWIFVPLSILIVVFFVVMLLRSPLRRKWWFNLICTLILSGAIGNLIDRIAYGVVTDFISFAFIDFPTFNLADCYVVLGAIALFIAILFGSKKVEDVPLRTLLFDIPVKNKEQ